MLLAAPSGPLLPTVVTAGRSVLPRLAAPRTASSPFLSSPSPRSTTGRLRLKPASASYFREPHTRPSPGFSSRFREVLLLLLFLAAVVAARALLGILPSDFSERWRHLLAFSEEAESECVDLPRHLVQAIVASEDRRFFRHVGVDPVGIARAVVYFPRGGGGSTITQQLVKNVFLKQDRKVSRKVMEIVLALALERKMSKQRILYSYMSKIYWGHGIHGIKSASIFYFGKQPSLLSLGESAMLAGMLPAPEIFSPFKHQSRGKYSQARALRKMVDAGFIDIKVALLVVGQTLGLRDGESENGSGYRGRQKRGTHIIDEIWDWESASRVWEATEYLESWGMRKDKHSTSLSQRRLLCLGKI